ncbi:serine/threonine protein kinase [Actinacidiphila yanglinensis]|uniref:non-specific serine/threonine protein kinase n=1 Tax=Actinacidiphila yanglinensis TaxID=310779 RepID=A0A1H6D093_9ACTN|nr:serine/threonine protein kinase [Actinacidiphila yanglinensis]
MARKIGSRYTAHQVLGRGSAGTVWLGEGPEGPVAIKLLREDLASDQDLVGRFVQERTALLSLDDPHIVGIRDLVVDGTDLALVMELVRGTDLRSRLERERRLVPEAAVAIAADVADGLSAAHAGGVVHRDVKPENVLLDSAAVPGPGGAPPALLTDFGIARLVDTPRRTRATRIIGTPDYLAPEIIEGLPPRASVDIYALATVLYELLAGFTPFGGGHPGAVLRRHVTETVQPLPGLPRELWQILAQCLAKAPASRLKAGELGARLRELLPSLAGLPALDVAAPGGEGEPLRGGGADGAYDDADEPMGGGPGAGTGRAAAHSAGPGQAPDRRRGAVPLVRGAAPDSSRDTHTSIKLPTAEELAGFGAEASRSGRSGRPDGSGAATGAGGAGGSAGGKGRASAPGRPASPRHRSVSDAVRQRRIKFAAAAAAALAVAGLGGWGIASAGSPDHSGRPAPGGTSSDDKASTSDSAHGAKAAGHGTPTAPTGAADAPQGRTGAPVAMPKWSSFSDAPAAGVPLTGGPRALVVGSDTYVFARGADKNIWYVVRDGSGYGPWHRLTGISVDDDPAVVSARPGTIDLFALGTDGLLYRRTLAGGYWKPWIQVDERTHFDAAPAAASSAPGRIDLVGRVGGDLVTASLVDGRWNAWALVPTAGRITYAPALVSRGRGTLDAFVVRKADDAVLRLPFSDGAWRPAAVLTGVDATTRIEALASGDHLYVFGDGTLVDAADASDAAGGSGTGGAEPASAVLLPRGTSGPIGAAAAHRTLEVYALTAKGRLSRATAAA